MSSSIQSETPIYFSCLSGIYSSLEEMGIGILTLNPKCILDIGNQQIPK